MAGPFDQAQQQTDAAKAAALAALASGGSQAMAAHKAAQEQQGALRAEAVRSALVRASAIDADEAGADLAANGSMAGLAEAGAVPGVGAIYDRYAADQGRAGAARTQAMGDMAKANSNYFSQVNAARPIVEGNARAARASAVAKIVEAQRKEQEAAAKAAKQEERDSQRDIFDLYGGVEGFRDVVKNNADIQNDSWAVQRGANGPGSTPKPYAQIATEEAERSGLARPVAGAIGLRLGRERAEDEARRAKEADKATSAERRANVSAAEAAKLRGDRLYSDASADIEDELQGGALTYDGLVRYLQTSPSIKGNPKLRALLLAEYEDQVQ